MTALPPARFDAARFQRLLALVGPAMVPDLLRQLEADLTANAAAIDRGCRNRDWAALREASHVLISLAGSAGAMALHEMAQGLNAAVHARDTGTLDRLAPALTADLQALIALVQAAQAGAG